MSLTSLTYLLFLFVCVCVYYILPGKAKELCLLTFSIFFYACVMPKQLLIMMAYIWGIFVIGRGMHVLIGVKRKLLLVVGISLSVGFLFFYKYLDFSCSLLGIGATGFSLVVPIGISYITFQCISYLVELYKGNLEVVTNPVSFFVYTLLFMKVTAGPIESPKTFFDNLYSKKSATGEEMLHGLLKIAMGFVKKMVIADALAPSISTILDAPSDKDGLSILLAVCMYSLQIYFDFSGYTDIARGSAALFGISLTENFVHPYMAGNIRQFWRRWHISLSDWLKNYVYIPLGGSRVGAFRKYINVLIVFFISGIWHGASVTFIVWGLLHGIYQVIEMLVEPLQKRIAATFHIQESRRLHSVIGSIRTFILATVAWIFFRATSVGQAVTIIKRVFAPWENIAWVYDKYLPDWNVLLLILIAMVFVWIAEFWSKTDTKLNRKTVIIAVAAIWLVLLYLVFTAGTDAVNSFIYFDF